MAKRKRNTSGDSEATDACLLTRKPKPKSISDANFPITVQIVVGSYSSLLHGFTATVTSENNVEFADTFSFTPHRSAIRTLALSPPSAPIPKQRQKMILASGGSDNDIQLYHLSLHGPPSVKAFSDIDSSSQTRALISNDSTSIAHLPISSKPTIPNPHHKQFGALLHHQRPVTALYFPNRAKLLSSAEDRNIAITRTRDWSVLSEIKTPAPKEFGRPSGDTEPSGSAPSGVNHFAVHPSMKLMISVGKGEKCMRLWNLVTGKKAGVLNFEREHLIEVGEGRHSRGEGRKVAWGSTIDGNEFCVAFDRGVLVYGMDSKPKCKVVPKPRTMLHQLKYIQLDKEKDFQIMAISTDDGRILFYSTRLADLMNPGREDGTTKLPTAKLVAQLGGKTTKSVCRIKDFSFVSVIGTNDWIVVTGNSEGDASVWLVSLEELTTTSEKAKQAGKLLGTYETSRSRITCLEAYLMLPSADAVEEEDVEDIEGVEESGVDSTISDSD